MNGAKPKLMLFSHICSQSFVTGAEKLLLLFVREMVRRFQCVMVVPQQGAIAEKARSMGVQTIVLDIPLCISLYTAAPSIIEELEAMKKHPSWSRIHTLLAEERPDYVFVNTSVHPLPALAAKSMGIPTIWAVMETIMDRPSRSVSVSIISSNSDMVVGISHSTLQPIQELAPSVKTYLLPPYLIRDELLPNSWSYHRLRIRQQYGWGEYHRVAGYLAATIYTSKGLEHFVNAMLPIAATDVRARFLIMGNSADDAYYWNCQKLARQSGYGDRFLFLPFADQIQHAYPVMDVLVVPSIVAEGFGMTALEGLMFGKGVVSYASGGLAEIMKATDNDAFLVNSGDINGLTERVNTLFHNEELLKAVGERNVVLAQRTFGVDAFRSRLELLIEQLPPAAGYRRGSIWRGSSLTVFLVEHGVKRPFASERAFLLNGYQFEDVTVVSDHELNLLPTGPTISEARHRKSGKGRRRRNKKMRLRAGKKHTSGKRRGRKVRSRKTGKRANRRRR